MELLQFMDDKDAKNIRNKQKNCDTLPDGMSFAVAFLFYQTHCDRIYGYLGAEKIMEIFGCTDDA